MTPGAPSVDDPAAHAYAERARPATASDLPLLLVVGSLSLVIGVVLIAGVAAGAGQCVERSASSSSSPASSCLVAVPPRGTRRERSRPTARARVGRSIAAHRTVMFARSFATHYDRVPIADGAPVARLVIPKIGLDEIVLEGVDGEALNAGPGHLPGTALPGERGNAVISAHRDRHFKHFDRIDVGDTITTESAARRNRWVVISTRVVDADAPALFRTTDATLTLTTCWPIRYVGTAPERLIVTAKPVSAGAAQRRAAVPSLSAEVSP